MKEDKKKYTFDDWLNGVPAPEYVDIKDPEIIDEFEKIFKAKEHGFEIAVKIMTKDYYDSFIREYSRSQNPEQLKNSYLQILKKQEQNPALMRLVNGPRPELIKLNGFTYKHLLECEENKRFSFSDLAILEEPKWIWNKINAVSSYKSLKKIEAIGKKESNKKSNNKQGDHMKAYAIVPEDDFWDEAKTLYDYKGDDCISQRDPNNPSEWMKDQLYDKGYEGYEKRDTKKEHPKKLSKRKIRDFLIENPEKWR